MDRPEETRIEWSYSNARLYDACPRALYHRQSVAGSGDGTTGPLRIAGQPDGSIIGQAVHHGLASEIDEWRRGNEPSLHGAQAAATAALSSAFDEESDKRPDAEVESITSTVKAHLRRFFRQIWSRFSSHRYISHEETTSFEVGSNTVWVKADLCTRAADGTFVITDWKTRSPDVFENQTLQLTVYALWAQTAFEPELDRIRAQLVFTSNGEVVRRSVTKSEIDTLIQRIKNDSRVWNQEFSRSNFPAQSGFEKCSQCPYLSECGPGKRVVQKE